MDWHEVYERIRVRVEACGIEVRARKLGPETTGVFDGLSITTNTDFDWETRCHNVAHSFGHIVQWSAEFDRFRQLYDDLNAAKPLRGTVPAQLAAALDRFREYEEEASQYAAWLFLETGNAEAIPAFTNFARADIEAIVAFHRDGIAPLWQDFYQAWNARVIRGELRLLPFEPKLAPSFVPLLISEQEVIQEVDGHPHVPV